MVRHGFEVKLKEAVRAVVEERSIAIAIAIGIGIEKITREFRRRR